VAFTPPEFRAGLVLSARALHILATEIERLGKLDVLPPLTLADDAAGFTLGAALPERWYIKLTSHGSGSAYAWTRQIPATGGTWAAHPSGRTGTTTVDAAREVGGNDVVDLTPNPVVMAWRDPVTGVLLFQMGPC
jgi:hypothetical protein